MTWQHTASPCCYEGTFNDILTEHVGRLGVAEYSDPNLKLWTWEASGGTDAHWVLSRVINLVSLLPVGGALLDADSGVEVVAFSFEQIPFSLTRSLASSRSSCNRRRQGRCAIGVASVIWFQLSASTLLCPEASIRILRRGRSHVVRRGDRTRKQ